MSPTDIFLHISYVLLVGASLVRNILPLRILAIASGCFAIVYDVLMGLEGAILWEITFTLVNLVQVGIIINERRKAQITAEEESLRQRMFGQLSVVDFHRMIRTGTWITTPNGETLTEQGKPVSRIVLITDGAAKVEIDKNIVAYCREGDWVGEMAFVSGNNASATVATIAPTRYLMWRSADLIHLLEKHPDVRTALQSVFNRNLIEKLSREGSSKDDRSKDQDIHQ